jgi:hypothetical protein
VHYGGQLANGPGQSHRHERFAGASEKVRIDWPVVRFDEHGFGETQHFAFSAEECPVVSHEGGTRLPHKLGDHARLTGAACCRQRYSMAVKTDRRRMEHAYPALN